MADVRATNCEYTFICKIWHVYLHLVIEANTIRKNGFYDCPILYVHFDQLSKNFTEISE